MIIYNFTETMNICLEMCRVLWLCICMITCMIVSVHFSILCNLIDIFAHDFEEDFLSGCGGRTKVYIFNVYSTMLHFWVNCWNGHLIHYMNNSKLFWKLWGQKKSCELSRVLRSWIRVCGTQRGKCGSAGTNHFHCQHLQHTCVPSRQSNWEDF